MECDNVVKEQTGGFFNAKMLFFNSGTENAP